MRKGIVSLLVLSVAFNAQAAKQSILWGEASRSQLQPKQPNRQPKQPNPNAKVIKSLHSTQSDYQLQPVASKTSGKGHTRYQLTFKGLPVWGHQLIFHDRKGAEPEVTGIQVSGIERDIRSIQGKLSAAEVERQILSKLSNPVKFKTVKKVIYIDAQEKAHLAYHLSFYLNQNKTLVNAPNYLVDANNGQVLKAWNEARHERVGQGLGGNAFDLPYRPGMFQHGDALPNLASLGKFDVQIANGLCYLQNDSIKVINFENAPVSYGAFPLSVFDEAKHQIEAFSYPCSPDTGYINYSDGASGPMNYAFSPVNDTMYFAQETIEMYEKRYGVKQPFGDDLPIRAYTHLGEMDNAFAIPSIVIDGILMAHQQIAIGNGGAFLTAPTQGVIAHELSHNFTQLNARLVYDGQAGAINEAFSDMASIALQDYLRQRYPWYWDGQDWTLGREAVISGEPLRYMDDPTQDGASIAHTRDYHAEVDVHHSSGIFNKAFYLLASKPGWSVQMAFQLMVDANRYYWSPIAYFDFAACGVIQAALDRELDKQPVIEAFAEVGVHCPMH